MTSATHRISVLGNGKRELPATIIKRNGREVKFDPTKIADAVERCITNGLHQPKAIAHDVSQHVVGCVLNLLFHSTPPVTVEDIQNLTIQQLWANGHFDAAEHYTIYREERRKARLASRLTPEHQALMDADVRHFPTPMQYYQFLSKFARWREEDQRRETWGEACARTVAWFRKQTKLHVITEQEWIELHDGLYNMEAACSLRSLQMAGPALDRCNSGLFNCCACAIQDIFSFQELLYLLMQGCGVGFSVEDEYICQLPRIKKQKKSPAFSCTIDDSTEGWCDALGLGLTHWCDGHDVVFDYSAIRPKGARLKTKGGRSSGPAPLKELLDFCRSLILSRQGRYLEDIDVHDICCMIGQIVQVGGVRRAATISISDRDSMAMRKAKFGNWIKTAPWRNMANNSAVYDGRPSDTDFMEEWLSLAQSGSGERGIFNREAACRLAPKRRKRARFQPNPCGEINLRPFQMCNLSIAVARHDDTVDSLARKVRLATMWGVIQSTCTDFGYIRPIWKKNCDEERLLGVDITGHADCPLLRFGAQGRSQLLDSLLKKVQEVKRPLSARLGISESTADTCVKPGGDSSVLFNCGSGISPQFSTYKIRWVRESKDSPVSQFLVNEGVLHAESPGNSSLLVFGFPIKAPEGATLRHDLTAIQQLENWLEWKQHWAEHSVSFTCYVGPDEWMETGNWVLQHFNEITGVSFLPRDNGNYRYAPNEEISKEEYEKMLAAFPSINWAKLIQYEHDDRTESSQAFACHGDSCLL